MGNFIGKIQIFFSFGGHKPPPLNRSRRYYFGREERTWGVLLPAKFHLDRCSVTPAGRKTRKSAVSKRNTGRVALRADPAGKNV